MTPAKPASGASDYVATRWGITAPDGEYFETDSQATANCAPSSYKVKPIAFRLTPEAEIASLRARCDALAAALRQIAQANHPDYPHFKSGTEGMFADHLIEVAAAALAAHGAAPTDDSFSSRRDQQRTAQPASLSALDPRCDEKKVRP